MTGHQALRGVRSLNFCPPGTALILGNELLAEADPDYSSGTESKYYRVATHTVERVLANLGERVPELPVPWTPPPFIRTAVDTFVGYLLLDALVANTDRHHENWAVVRLTNGTLRLAPTFDHASSLGRNLSDEEREDRLRTRDRNRNVEAFAARAKSALYRVATDSRPLSPLDAFREAAGYSSMAALGWLNLLSALSDIEVATIINDVPRNRISDTAAEFARRLVFVNKNNLLKVREELR